MQNYYNEKENKAGYKIVNTVCSQVSKKNWKRNYSHDKML